MRRRERAGILAVLLLILILGAGPGTGCATREPSRPAAASSVEQQSSRDDDLFRDRWDDRSERERKKPTDVAGELLVVILFVGSAIGLAVLPFLLL